MFGARSSLVPPALCALLLAGACQTPDWAVYNLRETHHLDGSVRRTGNPYSAIEYAVMDSLRGLNVQLGVGQELFKETDEVIDDPLALSLEALVALDGWNRPDAREAGLMVEAFTWLAVDDDYVLARERAVLGLGRAALRLSLTDGPRALPPGSSPAGPERVGPVIADLLRAARRGGWAFSAVVDAEGAPPLEMSAACAAAAALVLDREGARRVLAAVNGLLGFSPPSADRTALDALSLDMQRRCVEQTLAAALDDPSGTVRAVALRAAVEATGNHLPALVRNAALDPDWRVALEAMHLLQEYGLPRPPGELPEGEQETLRELWFLELAQLALHRDPRVGTAACEVLSLHAGAGFESLRPEDWAAWLRRRAEAAR